LGLVAIPGTYWVLSSIGGNVSETVLTKERHELVQHGPYRWIRHPLYTLGALLLLAEGLMLASWLVLLFALLAFVVFRFVVVPIEERQLELRFGDAYRQYRQVTGAMLPRVL
jgi:protein-S-isoprenylcysteine O-methyltransferase Ste14